MSMSYKCLSGLLLAAALFCAFAARGQGSFQVAKQTANPDSKMFDDGKTSVEQYINDYLKENSNCCGTDKIYMQVVFKDNGYAQSVRALNGRNDCIKQSVEDAISFVKWDISSYSKKQVIISIQVDIACDEGKDNAYKKLPPPIGFNVSNLPAKSDGPISSGGTGGKSGGGGQSGGVNTQDPKQTTPKETGDDDQGQYSSGRDPKASGSQPKPKSTTGGANNNLVGRDGLTRVTPESVDSTVLEKQIPLELPRQRYESSGDKHPDSTHVGTIANIRGPRYATPDFVDGPGNLKVFIKSTYRKFGVCGLVHVFAEVGIDENGRVDKYRILKVNNDEAERVTPFVIGSMRFRPVNHEQFFYIEFKSDIECPGMPKVKLEQVGAYFVEPDKAARVPADSAPADVIEEEGGDDDVIKEPTDG